MTTPADPVELLSRALDQASCVVAGVQPDQSGASTPCRSWDVAQLLGHLLDDLRQFTVRAEGGSPSWAAPAPAEPGSALLEEFQNAAEGLLAAWRRAGDLTGTVQVPGMGELPARFPVDQQVAELAVHTWDLAVAGGQPIDLDEEIAETALAWARGALRPEFRGDEAGGKAFGPEVAVWEDVPAYDRLAAFFGREPVY